MKFRTCKTLSDYVLAQIWEVATQYRNRGLVVTRKGQDSIHVRDPKAPLELECLLDFEKLKFWLKTIIGDPRKYPVTLSAENRREVEFMREEASKMLTPNGIDLGKQPIFKLADDIFEMLETDIGCLYVEGGTETFDYSFTDFDYLMMSGKGEAFFAEQISPLYVKSDLTRLGPYQYRLVLTEEGVPGSVALTLGLNPSTIFTSGPSGRLLKIGKMCELKWEQFRGLLFSDMHLVLSTL